MPWENNPPPLDATTIDALLGMSGGPAIGSPGGQFSGYGFDFSQLGSSFIWASAEPAPSLPEPTPPLQPQPGPPPGPFPEPANDPVIEPSTPRTPITPEPLPPVGEPTLPPQPMLPEPVDIPPGRPSPVPPWLGPLIGESGFGPVLVGIGGLLWPSTIGPEPDVPWPVPPVDIPPPQVPLPEPRYPLPEPQAPPLARPDVPDVVVVSAPAPKAPPLPRGLPNIQPITNLGRIPWPILRFRPRPRPQPVPRASATPTVPQPSAPPIAQPLPTTPPLPGTPPMAQPSSPPVAPSVPPAPVTPLTPSQTASVESPPAGDVCETPQQTKDRREKARENCRKLVKIRVKAHWKRVCVQEAVKHEAKRYRKKLVRKYITKPAGELGRKATDWALREVGLTPYAEQAKEIKKRVSDLTKKQKRYYYEIPGTHVKLDPVDWIPNQPKVRP